MIEPVIATIREQKVTAEFAVSVILRKFASNFLAMSDRYLSDRVKDIYDIERRILHNLFGQRQENLAHLTNNVVVIAHDLLPSQTAGAWIATTCAASRRMSVGAPATRQSWARALGIPAVVGLGNITTDVSSGDTIIIDGNRGVVIINPDEEQLTEHREYERPAEGAGAGAEGAGDAARGHA